MCKEEYKNYCSVRTLLLNDFIALKKEGLASFSKTIELFSCQGTRLLHSNQSAQLILQAAFPLQQQGTFTQATLPQQQQRQQQQQSHHQRHQQQLKPQPQKLQKAPSSHRTDSVNNQPQ